MNPMEENVYRRLLARAKGSRQSRVATLPTLKWLGTAIGDPIELRQVLSSLRAAGKLAYSSGSRGEPVSPFITVHAPQVAERQHVLLWRSIIEHLNLEGRELEALEPLGASLEGFSELQMRDFLHCLFALRANLKETAGRPLLSVSAEYLLGSSKLLGSLDARSLKYFGIEIQAFASRPAYLVVASAPCPQAVVLVENPVAFEMAVESRAAETCTFVCTFGFGLSNVANEYGYQLANIVTTNRATLLHRTSGANSDLSALLAHPHLYFWGDLDQAGIQIFERIATRIPHIRFSGLYQPMLDASADARRRHPYALATGKAGQSLYTPQREDARLLAARCVDHAVDQEIVTAPQIEALAAAVLKLNN